MVYGGQGIQGIAETPFYRFISSPDGLSQLGIEKTEPPKLLQAYERTIKVIRSGRTVKIRFGDMALLKMATPHPASGTGNLQVESWLEWIFDGTTVERGFVPRARLPKGAQKSIRVGTSPGGLMLPRGSFGSAGVWRFPQQLADFERVWFQTNIDKIQKLIQKQIIVFLNKGLK
jgi:hypothetical protein